MKKLLALAVVIVLVFTVIGCTQDPSLQTLTVGTPEMNGDFINGFGNSAYDLSIKTLLHGYYDTYTGTPIGEIVLNTAVVDKVETSVDATGNKTYLYTLKKLKWSDGSNLTAKDYVFSFLFQASPEWVAAGATSSVGEGLVGYSAYYAGETDVFAGIKYISDTQFSVTIDAAELPYFYETVYASAGPLSLAVWAPGMNVESDANGSRLTGADLAQACTTVASTQRNAPTISCGPYKFVSFENQIVTLEINPNFVGDLDGKKPTIKYIVQKSIPQDTDVDAVIAGSVDLVTGVVEGAKIEAAKASDTAGVVSYLRNGYGMLSMHCDWGVTADPNVRWALACLIDRAEVIDYVLGGYGGTVDSGYGLAQWMYQLKKTELLAALKPISFNVATANQYLDKSEWIFEADGKTAFDPKKATDAGTYLRHNAAGEKLVVNHLGTTNNPVTDIIEIQYVKNSPLAGVEFKLTKSDFNALLDNYYYSYELKEGERIYNSFNLATGFNIAYDPYYSWHSEFLGTWYNANQLSDPEIDRLTLEMRRLDPSQKEEFANLWVEFQVRLQELMPVVPLYSNEYFDIHYKTVKGLATTPFASWDDVICKISKSNR